jgi:hypothetical protein
MGSGAAARILAERFPDVDLSLEEFGALFLEECVIQGVVRRPKSDASERGARDSLTFL